MENKSIGEMYISGLKKMINYIKLILKFSNFYTINIYLITDLELILFQKKHLDNLLMNQD